MSDIVHVGLSSRLQIFFAVILALLSTLIVALLVITLNATTDHIGTSQKDLTNLISVVNRNVTNHVGVVNDNINTLNTNLNERINSNYELINSMHTSLVKRIATINNARADNMNRDLVSTLEDQVVSLEKQLKTVNTQLEKLIASSNATTTTLPPTNGE